MIYPDNFESKIAFSDIRTLLKSQCLSVLGKELADSVAFSTDVRTINEWLEQTREFRRLQEEADNFPLQYLFDVREALIRLKPEGTHLDEDELFDLKRTLSTICDIVRFLSHTDEDEQQTNFPYPALHRLTEHVAVFPQIVRDIDQILDKFGKIKDSASPQLDNIRRQLAKTEGSISKALVRILKSAQSDGVIEKDVTPTMRDGRLVIPVVPFFKRKISGIVHDESASGRTVYVEPTEVVEANNKIRELENEERREIIRILTEFSKSIRPYINDILHSYTFLATIDLIRAKAELAKKIKAIEPHVGNKPHIDWIMAVHPLLRLSLEKHDKHIVPLDITLTNDKRMLIISGPNAGGKSVCLKTVGLLQYMLQCGLSIPISERSHAGIFKDIMIDIGDEQSIDNDLSTYSSHLMNMKNMMRQANAQTLILIDEFGTGTEPQIGGAIAQSVLKRFCLQKAYGVITTHYQNLKHFADSHEGVVNGAMLYDRKEMKPLFQLAIGQPGSSFAIDIARKIGLPESVINEASEIVGFDYVQSDKYLQDIVRDKRYWEHKRQAIHHREKDVEKTISNYEQNLAEIERNRKEILQQAKQQADDILRESNKKIENAIREIKEKQAEKIATKSIRDELNSFKEQLQNIDTKANDDKIAQKIAQIQRRKERKSKRKEEQILKAKEPKLIAPKTTELQHGDIVRIKGATSIGTIEAISGKNATVIFGSLKSKVNIDRLERTDISAKTNEPKTRTASNTTRETIDNHKLNFNQDIDVRGMRAEEAISAVRYFIDDAILVGMNRVRILHGKGNGILRTLIRQYLATVPVSSARDEHVQFGGAGITVVDI